MHFFEGKRYCRSSRMIWEGSDQSCSEEEVYKSDENNNNVDWLSELYAARDKILQFI